MIAALLLSTVSWAQQAEDLSVNTEIFQPHADLYGYSATQGAATLGHLQLGVGAWGNYSNDPIVMVDAKGNRLGLDSSVEEDGDGVVDDRFVTNFQVGMGFTRFVSLTLDLPVALMQDAWQTTALSVPDGTDPAAAAGGLGDLRVQPKIAVLDRDQMPLGLAIAVPVGVPTGKASYFSDGGVTVAPRIIAEFSDQSVRNRTYKWRVAVNAGYLLRNPGRIRDVNLGNEFQYAAAFGYHVADPVEVDVEFHGSSMGTRASQNPAEALVGAKILLGRWVAFNVGGGTAVLGGVGAPDYRLYGGFQLAPSFDPDARDTDEDNLPDGQDKCKNDAEDMDGFQDGDGCPELDNDADGREDGVDKCPDDPEDDDGYMDNDGCPDTDNDKDGVTDANDRCADQAETVNGFADEDGCPDDKPVDDTDGDGFKDDVDRCPYDPEDMNQFEDEDGCPDDRLKNARVVVTKGAIKINDVIYFDTGKATIQQRSYSLLDEIAGVIAQHPDIKKIRVEGHTDDVGNDMNNFKLSQARAESVMAYLVSKGIDKGRLDAAGFGEMRPLTSNATEEGKAQNRRVEFIIVDRE